MSDTQGNDYAAKRELLESRMKEREVQRTTENNKQMKSDINTEELVAEFYKKLDVKTREIETRMNNVETVTNEDDIKNILGIIMQNIQSLQEMVADAGLYLPSYDSKKSQHTIAELNNRYQVLQDKVKPKKKFGFKNKKQKSTVPDVSSLTLGGASQVDSVRNVENTLSMENSCNVKRKSNETITLERNQVQGKDVVLADLVDCNLNIHGAPLTLHLSNITGCNIKCGPVSTSVMVDTCSGTCLTISCQQLRTHSTTDTDIYLHTTARAILEDCKDIRVAPYNWTYPDIDLDYHQSGLDKNVNNWDKIGDFNWLSVDKPSPNWKIIPENERIAQ